MAKEKGVSLSKESGFPTCFSHEKANRCLFLYLLFFGYFPLSFYTVFSSCNGCHMIGRSLAFIRIPPCVVVVN